MRDGHPQLVPIQDGTGLNGSAPRLAAPPSEPSVIHLVIDNFYDNDVPHPSVTRNRVEEPPKRWQVLHEYVLHSMFVLQEPRNPVLLDDLAVRPIRNNDQFDG